MVENLSFDLWSNKFILVRIKFEMFRGKVVWRFSFWESYFSSLICRKVNLKNNFVNWKNRFSNRENHFVSLKNHFVNWECHFSNWKNGFVNLICRFVNLKNDFVNLKNGFVSLKNGFVNLKNGFVNLKNDFVNLKNGFVNCSYRNLDLFCGVFSIENGWSYQKQPFGAVLEQVSIGAGEQERGKSKT